jgi:hypothetical protein
VAKESEDNLEAAVTEQIELRDAGKVFDLCKKIVPEGESRVTHKPFLYII